MLKKNNEYKLLRLEIKSKYHQSDIKNINLELIVYNDLFLEFLTADLMLTDSNNMIKRLPIVGGEEVIVEFQDQYENMPVKLSFIVWKVSKQEGFTQANQMYKLNLVSPNWYKSMSMKKYTRIKGNAANHIQTILNDTSLPNISHVPYVTTDKAAPEVDLYANGITPFETIRKIMFDSHDHANNPWIFYQDLEGYKFRSFSNIMNDEIYEEIYLQPIQQQDYEELDKTRIADHWERSDNQDKVHIDQRGSQRTNNITFSLTKKNLDFSDFDYQRDFDKIPTLEDVPLDRIDKPEFKTRCFVHDSPEIAKQANIRTAIFTMMEDNVFYVNISGDTKFTSGRVLKMDVPSKESFTKGYQYEEDLSGRFLITSSRHHIKRDSYRVQAELMKESLVRKL